MKITIEIPDTHIDGALASPHSRYWASEAHTPGRDGYAIEACDSGPVRHWLGATRLKLALIAMYTSHPKQFSRLASGDYDGETGDMLLQLMCFRELKYG